MSYILDALKKVEHEKTRKLSSVGMTRISGDLFKETRRHPSGGGVRKIVCVIISVSLVTFAVTWFLAKSDKKGGATSRSSMSTAVTVTPPRPVSPQPALPPVSQPVSPPQQAVAPQSPSVAPPVIPQPSVTVLDNVEPVSRTGEKGVKSSSVPPRPATTALQTIPAPADIKVAGIAWQEEPALRRVVVNGFLLKEGATVSGAKILEIHKDRVRFSSPAGIFDAILNNTKGM